MLIDKLLVNQNEQQLSRHDNDEVLTNNFTKFFEDKIDTIRSNFTIINIDEIPPLLDTLCLDHFRPARSYDEVYQLITSCHILVLMTSQLIALFVYPRTLLSSSGLQNMYVSFWRLPGFFLILV